MDTLFQSIMTLLTIAGILVFAVNIITQLTKEVGFLSRIPTKVQVLILSIVFTVLSYFIYVSLMNASIIWYYVVGSVFAGFLVAYIAIYGWDKLFSEWNRSKKPDNITDDSDK